MADQLVVELIVDASQANAGANAFEQSANRIEQASTRATASVDRLGQALDRMGERTQQSGRAQAAALDELAGKFEDLIRRQQSGGFNVLDAQVAFSSLAQIRQNVNSGNVPAAGTIAAMPFDRSGVSQVVTPASVAPFVSAAAASFRNDPVAARSITQATSQAELNDSSIARDRAQAHSQEAALASVVPPVGREAAEEGKVDLPAFQRVVEAIELSSRTNLEGLGGVGAAIKAAIAPAHAALAAAAPPAGPPPPPPPPIDVPAWLAARQPPNAVDTEAWLKSRPPIPYDFVAWQQARQPPNAVNAEAFNSARVPTGGIDVAAWNAARSAASQAPNEVNVEEWNKARRGPESFLTSLKNLFTGARSGTGDLKEAAAGVTALGDAAEHAAGAGGRMREGFVILRELGRGDLTRLIGSATIELQRFGLLHVLFNPLTAAVEAFVGVLGLAAYKAAEVDANLRSFTSTIKVMGDGSLTSAVELERLTERLEKTGVGSADAKKTITEIERSGIVRPGQGTEQFAGLARDISQYTGTAAAGTPDVAKDLTNAFSGPVEGAVKFAESLHALSAAQIVEIHYLDQHAQSGEALRRVYTALRATVPGFAEDLSPIQKALLDITNAWKDFILELSKSNVPGLITGQVKAMLDDVKEMITSVQGLFNFIKTIREPFTAKAAEERAKLFPDHGPGSGNPEPYAAATLPEPLPKPRPESTAYPTQTQIANYATGELGLSASQGAALIGQARQESSFRTDAGLGTAHQGMFQWDAPRWANLQEFAKQANLDPLDYRTQLKFAKGEIQQKAPEFFTTSSLPEQNSILTKKFEVSGNYDKEIPRRLSYAQEALGSQDLLRASESQNAATGIAAQKQQDQIAIATQQPGADREAAQERQRLQKEAAENLPLGDQNAHIEQGMLAFWKERSALFTSQHHLNEQEIADEEKIARAFRNTANEGIRAQALVQAQQLIRERGGSPAEVPVAQTDFLRREAARESLSASTQIRIDRERAESIGIQTATVGQNPIDIQRQLSYVALRHNLEENFSQASPETQKDVATSASGIIEMNAALAQAEQHQERINQLFKDIAGTIDKEVGGALRNSLLATPLQASEHLKNYWRDLREGLRTTLADVATSVAQAAFIKPVTSLIASGLGLGKVAQEIGGFATGGSMIVGGTGGTDTTHVEFMATPGERVVVLTPAQAAHADKTGKLPHFAGGGMLDPATGDPVYFGEATFGREDRMMGMGTVDTIDAHETLGDEMDAWSGVLGDPVMHGRQGINDRMDVLSAAHANDAGDPVLRAPLVPPVAMPTMGRLGESFEAAAFPRTQHGDPLNLSPKDRLPYFADGGMLDPATGDTMSFGRADRMLPHGFAMRREGNWADYAKGEPPAPYRNYEHWWNYATATPKAFSDVFGDRMDRQPDEVGRQAYREPLPVIDPEAIKPARVRQTMAQIEDPYAVEQPEPAPAASDMPGFATGGSFDPATGETVYYNDAGQPFTVPGDTGGDTKAPADPGGVFGSLYDLSRKGLQSESDFLSAKAADQPLLGLDTGTGELTGRIPALADFMQQGLAGGAPAGTLSAGIKAFHGSPHDFEAFDYGKVGEGGTGAAYFGHGINLTESERRAKDYWKDLTTGSASLRVDGQRLDVLPADDTLRAAIQNTWSTRLVPKVTSPDDLISANQNIANEFSAHREFSNKHRDAASLIEQNINRITVEPISGGIYKAAINVEPENLLKWELPLSGQSEQLRSRVNALGAFADDMTGAEIYGHISERDGKAAASALLKRAGIPGIQHLDDQRPKVTDYVLFDDKSIDLLGKKGPGQRKYGPIPHFASGGTYDPATNQTKYFNDAGQPFSLPGDLTKPEAPVRGGFLDALPELANAGLKDYGEFVSGAKTYGQPFLGFDREKMEFTGRIPVLGDFIGSNIIDAQVGTKLTAQTLRELHVNKELQGKLADRMAAYGGLYETGQNAPQPSDTPDSPPDYEARAPIPPEPEASAPLPQPASGGFFDALPDPLPMLATGGAVVETGAAVVHKGEVVLPTEKTDDALHSVTVGLQGLSSVLGQTVPGLKSLASAAGELGAFVNIFKAGSSLFGSSEPSARAALPSLSSAQSNQSTVTVNNLASGATLQGPGQGGTINQSGNQTTITAGGSATAALPPEPEAHAALPPQEPTASASLPGTSTVINSATSPSTTGKIEFPSTAAPAAEKVVVEAATTGQIPEAASIAPQEPALSGAVAAATGTQQSIHQPAAAPASTGPLGNLSTLASGVSFIDKLNGSLPGFLPSFLQGGGGGSVGSFLSNPFGLFASQIPAGEAISQGLGPLAANAAGNVTVPGLFGTTATFGSFAAGAGLGFGAGSILNNLVGGNAIGGTVGSAGGSLLGSAIGSILLPGIGTALGGLIGGSSGGLLGGLVGGPPKGQSAGAVVGSNGQLSFNDTGGSQQNISASTQVAQQIGSFSRALSQLTDANGNPIGTLSGNTVVSSDNRQGIKVTGNNISGGVFGQNADQAVQQTELQLVKSLSNVGGVMEHVIQSLNDPSQLQTAVQFVDTYQKLNITSAQLTATLNGSVNAIGPFQQALTQTNATFGQLTAQAAQFGVDAAPIDAALKAVSQTLNQDFRISLDETFASAIDGGNDFLASLIKIHQTYVQATNDAQALADAVSGAAAAQSQAASAAAAPAAPPAAAPVPDSGVISPLWGFANGGVTPPGWILVGERGPEWMYQPGGATVLPNGVQPQTNPVASAPVGDGAVRGGLSNLALTGNSTDLATGSVAGTVNSSSVPSGFGGPFSLQGRAFADGTIGVGDIAGQVPGIGSLVSQAAGGPSLLEAAGGALGLGSGTLSTIGDVLPIAGPIVGGAIAALTGHPVQGAIGAAASLIGFALGGPVGGVIGSLVGLLGNFIGPKPSNKASGDLVDLASGAITGFKSAGNKNADSTVAQISAGISAISTAFQAATGGTITGAINVQDGARDGIKTSYSGPLGHIDAKWGSVSEAIGQFGLAIAHDLEGSIPPGLQAQLSGISDPDQLIPAIENYTGKGIDLGSSAPATAPPQSATSENGPQAASTAQAPTVAPAAPEAASPASPAPPEAQASGYQQVAGATYWNSLPFFANGGETPPGWILVGERGPEWMLQAGGATVLPNGVQPPSAPSPTGRSFADGTITQQQLADGIASEKYFYSTDINGYVDGAGVPVHVDNTATTAPAASAASASPAAAPAAAAVSPVAAATATTTVPAATPTNDLAALNKEIGGTEAAQAGTVLAGLGLDQLDLVIKDLGTVAPEIAAMAKSLIDSGNALPDFLTQGIQALTDPLDLAIEKEKAAGQERVAIVTQTGQDLVKVQQLNSANLVQSVISNLGNTNALNSIVYPNNTKALEYLQAAPTLAGLSGQQLTAISAKIGDVAPDLAALAQDFVNTGTALPDTITQGIEAAVSPLKLAIQQQAAQAEARTQIANVTGQDLGQVQALNSISVVQAVLAQINNPEAMQALVAKGNPQALTQLQAGPVLAGLGTDQLSALLTAIGSAAPNLTAMINALVASGRALPDALVQATQQITSAGLLAVEKASALGFEQVQTAAATGQSIPEAQTLAAAESAQAVAQATGTQLPINGLPDWITQIEEAATAPLQLAIQKERAAGAERVSIAQATGDDIVRIQRANANAVAEIWYQATASLTSLKNQITTGSLSGLTAANQVPASLEQFNQILALVQAGNTNFINDLSTAGQAAVQAAQTAYGNGPQTASVREQVLGAIQPFLVSASGYPTSGPTAIGTAATTTSGTGSDLQQNTGAIRDLTTAIKGSSSLGSASGSAGAATGASAATVSVASAASSSGASAPASGFRPDLSPTIPNLSAQYQALPASLQGTYNAVVAGNPRDYNDMGGLQNEVTLASLLTGFGSLSATGQSLVQATQAGNQSDYNLTPLGIEKSLALVELRSAYEALPPNTQSQFVATTSANPTLYSASASGVQSQRDLITQLAAVPAAPAAPPANSAAAPAAPVALTSNPVTGQSFTGSGITAVQPNYPTYPSATALSNSLADAIAGRATSSEWTIINQGIQAGILDPTKQPGYASIIGQAQQFAAGQTINPSAGLSQALSDAQTGTPSLQEWALINQAVNSGVISPTATPQYSYIIQQARLIANAQATSLSQNPDNVTPFNTARAGLPSFAAGTAETPPGLIVVGERGPEWMHPAANDNAGWQLVGVHGSELIDQSGGATILPFPTTPPGFADGTTGWQASQWVAPATAATGGQDHTAKILELLGDKLAKELQALRKQVQGGQIAEAQGTQTGHQILRQINQNVGPNISAPARRAVG